MPTLMLPRKDILHWNNPAKTVLKPSKDNGIDTDTKKRIVLVSPFSSLNTAFEHYVSKFDKNTEVDELSDAIMPQTPYVDVSKREEGKGNPYAIVDFRYIHLDGRVVKFNGYSAWAVLRKQNGQSMRALYLIPNPLFKSELMSQMPSEEEKFNKYNFKINGLVDRLEKDISNLIRGNHLEFKLFDNASDKIESGEWSIA